MTYGQIILMMGILLVGGAIIIAVLFSIYYSIRKKYLNKRLYEKYGL